MYKLKPFIFENSRVPGLLSKISPLNIHAVSFAWFVWCRGKITDRLRRHETIHFYQQVELLFLVQWLLYGIFYVIGRFKHGSWAEAYYNNPFEKEAYDNQYNENYFNERKYCAWTKYLQEGKMIEKTYFNINDDDDVYLPFLCQRATTKTKIL